ARGVAGSCGQGEPRLPAVATEGKWFALKAESLLPVMTPVAHPCLTKGSLSIFPPGASTVEAHEAERRAWSAWCRSFRPQNDPAARGRSSRAEKTRHPDQRLGRPSNLTATK